ncbi:multiple sugar transport system permease protein [Gracilibacillus ureilyticus]|uniref:Multiple sugar transport system permease protein n=2 Tax=Gracilibacillus ureilyticus TaxID=531814 RepID=A0A1H9UL12_9BACI|nr:multiple sugar transport system permease protein [Gracilibacillus ureilyticus]
MATTIIHKEVQNKPAKSKKGLQSQLIPWVFALPAMIPLIVFWIYPMIRSFWISLTDWDYISPTYTIVGLDNYVSLLQSDSFYQVLWNTFYFSAGTVIPTVLGGLLLAMLLVKHSKGFGIFRTILFSPWVTPTVAVSIVWSWIFEPEAGLANWLLSIFQVEGLPWTSSQTWAMPAIIIVTVWKGLGWSMIFYLNALKKIPVSLYEAASVDGASHFKKFLHISIPLVSPTTFFLIVVSTVEALQAYDQIQVMTQGGPAGSTRTLLYMYYQFAFEEFNMGKATALATVLVVITVILSLIQFVLAKKWVHYQ